MSDLSQRIAALSPEKRKLLLQQLNKKQEDVFSQSQIRPQSRESNSFPLSFAQQRLWFIDQLQSGNTAYNVFQVIRLTGLLNVSALEQSFNEIVRRHETLRTTIATVDGQPLQVITPTLTLALPLVDLRELPPDKREVEVLRRANEEVSQPFDLTREPLLRVTLLKLDTAEHVMLFTTHHIISDGWSLGVLIRELAALYDVFSRGKPSPLPELSIQYADFAMWQRQWLQGEVLETQLAYWRQHLGGAVPVLQLPTDFPRPSVQTFRGTTQSFSLSANLTEQLKVLSRKEKVTLFMTLLASFKTLLHRLCGQDDIVVSSPIASRNRTEIEGLIGFFANTLVLRTQLSGNPSFRQLLGRVREVALGAYSHQDLPFEYLVEVLHPERNLSHNPLFQVAFVLDNPSRAELGLPELTLSSVETESRTAKFDLTLSMVDTESGLVGSLEYATDLFNASTITRMLGHFQTLLKGIVTNPDQHLSDLPLLTAAEHHQLLVEWNNTQVDYSKGQCIHQLFEAQVERSPDAIAVVFENQHLTYRELNARANQLAHHLQTLGLEPEVLVGICVERSLEMVVGLLGILKAGGAYVPLDPAYPQARLTFMLEDASVSVLLTQARLMETLPHHQAKVICLDTDWDANAFGTASPNAQESEENPVSGVTSENLAYVNYTSGSTGQPKGAQVLHRGVIRLLFGVDYVHLDAAQTFLQMAPISFDASTFEVWGALLHGARCVLFPGNIPTSEELRNALQKHGITTLWLTAALFNSVIDDAPKALSGIRQLLIGGEALSVAHVLRAQEILPSTQIINGYGPTESTTFTCCYPVPKGLDDTIQSIPIGRPIGNTQVYLLDAQLRPLPIGVPGELYIGGAGLARGYLNRPDLTEEKFILNPFGDEPGTRLYKTGDLTRYLPDGNIEFLGRIDHQIKIRGFRIELGEIEAVLSQHPEVSQTVVIAREDVPGNKCLVAYIVPNQQSAPTSSDLRRFLKQKLPDYMMPAAFLLLETLPLTPNGKIDRQALPAPDKARPELDEAFMAPRTPIEQRLVSLWTQILDTSSVGIHDNFFELGGHSLLATQVISQVRKAFQIELPLLCLFESPTVAGLAKHIERTMRAGQGLEALPIKRVSQETELPLSFAQARLWFLHQLQPDSGAYNIPAAVHLTGRLNVTVLAQSFNEIVGRHAALRTMFTSAGGQPIQQVAPSMSLALPVVDLQHLPETEREAEVERLVAQEAQRPFSLAQVPLLRVTLLQLADAEHVVLLTMHHIVSDGWSMGVLIREFAVLYKAFLTGKPSPLPELPIQYADFAVWQPQWLQGDVLKEQLTYWQRQLAGSPVLQLPIDRARPVTQTFRGATQSFSLSHDLTNRLKTLSHKEGVTLFMTLLAAFKTLLYRLCGQDDIVVGTDVANRNRAETEWLIGFFVNLLVLRTDLSGYPSFRELLRRVRQVALGAYAHQDLPFEKLVEELQPERHLSHTPLFDVLFVLNNVPMSNLELPELTLRPLEVDSKTAKFDLALFITETEQGIVGNWNYNADLFNATTITRMSAHFEALLGSIVAQPDARINTLEMLTEAEKKKQIMAEVKQEEGKLKKFMHLKPKSVKLPQGQLIRTDYLHPGETLPLVVKPNVDELDLIDWAKSNREFIETKLLHHGAILFRGFNLDSVSAFQNLAEAICPELFDEYGDLPRVGVSGKVYASTPYPADKAILFHNESSHMHRWPLKIWFFCMQPAKLGGETPIVDCRKVYQLLDPEVRERFEQKQLMYRRNYTPGLDVSWKEFFRTTDKAVVEDFCRQAGIDFEWLSGDGLATRKICSAIAKHPKTGEMLFFNQLQLHHLSCLESAVQASVLSTFGEKNLPRHVYYGDGSPIEDSVMERIGAVYQQAKVRFSWQQGDVLMLDNMLVAHGRNPYVGSRQIVVAMGEMYASQNI